MTGQGPFVQTLPPHIRSTDSVAKRHWLKVAALLPVLIVAAVIGQLGFLRIFFLTLISVVGLEWVAAGFFRKKAALANGEAFLTGLLLAFLLPVRCPAALIILAAFLATFVISGCFGGLGSRLFNAAVFGRVFLDFAFPKIANDAPIFLFADNPWMFTAIVTSAIIFLARKETYFETPVFFIAIFLAGGLFFGRSCESIGVAGTALFSACFLLTDSTTMPLTRRGTNLFSAGAAFFSVFFGIHGCAAASIGYAILLMNCFTPWIDVWFRPKPVTVSS